MQRQIDAKRALANGSVTTTKSGERVGQRSDAWTYDPTCDNADAWFYDQANLLGNRLCLRGEGDPNTDDLGLVGWAGNVRSYYGGDQLGLFGWQHNGHFDWCYWDIWEQANSFRVKSIEASAQHFETLDYNSVGSAHCR